MQTDLSRREFLKYSLATGVLVAAGDATIATASAQSATKVTEVEKLTVCTVTDNLFDGLAPDSAITKRFRIGPGRSMHAEHGLSFFVEAVVGGKTSACLYDFGLDPVGVMNNMSVLGIDLGKVDAFALSHGHFDHYQSSTMILKNGQSRIARGTPFYVGEEAFARRYYALRPGSPPLDMGQLRKEDVEAAGVEVVEVKTPLQVVPGVYSTGRIGRVTDYEKVPPAFLVQRGDKLEHDQLFGEQALFANIKDKGLVVLSGCGHAGIVNTVKHAQKVAGVERVHAVIGGCHLSGAKPELVQSTIADLKGTKPDHMVPTHCTGFDAIVEFRREMPNAFILNTAGARYTFTA